MRALTQTELNEILEKHKLWLDGDPNGERANLSWANLSRANLRRANLSEADLSEADLSEANLSMANLNRADLSEANLSRVNLRRANLSRVNLRRANLSEADLSEADLSGADLSGADLSGADLRGVNLSGAILSGADLSGVRYNSNTAFFAMQCPEKGSFIGYKKANGCIVELEILADAKRSSATTRKCRCDAARVLSITKLDGSAADKDAVPSDYDANFIYRIGEVVRVDDFNGNRWAGCAPGIHFFITRDEAVNYS